MIYDQNEDYQYDGCVSRGICSVNPKTSSLQEVLIMYLKVTSYYALKLYENENKDKKLRDIILDTISVLVSNPEFSETDFKILTERFNKILPYAISNYEEECKNRGIVPECLKSTLKFNKTTDIVNSIQLGEKEFLKKTKSTSQKIRDLYTILFVLAKSLCINISDLESFGENTDSGYLTVLKLLNSLNAGEKDAEKLKRLIYDITDADNDLMKQLRQVQEKRYGKQRIKEVSYTTTPGKAILVVGSNIRELEEILEAVKDTDISVYTHDEMMLANTFPKFEEYQNLKGQYGQGIENCLLDFATFPGPIILTKHSLYNVEHLYRGRLYTTDSAFSKGVIPVKNKDFGDVIKSAELAKGFKTGRQCETVSLGYNYDVFIENIKNRLTGFSKIIFIGLGGYTLEQQAYFEKFLKHVPEDILVISLSFCLQKNNVVCLNACFDEYSVIKIVEGVRNITSVPQILIFPRCGRHTISQMLYFSGQDNLKIYVGKCTPVILNPNMITTLSSVFGIHGLTSVKKDIEDMKK